MTEEKRTKYCDKCWWYVKADHRRMIGPCPYICNNKTEYGYCIATGCINPKVNAHGIAKEDNWHWIWKNPSDDCQCSNCGMIVAQRYPNCPWCGKKMNK